MTRSYLPLNSLRAFEAAARHLSFTHAAIELNVTHSAISQHVKALEQHLNCQLFVRVSRGLMLTTEGENLLPVLNDSFDRIAGMLDRFASQRAQEKLKIGVVGTFATGVLFSQLADFRRCYPHIDLQLSTHNNRVDPAAEGLITPFVMAAGRGTARKRRFFALHRLRRFARLTLQPRCTPLPIS
jgi:LysR family transcriptional regulator of beta-lactamase